LYNPDHLTISYDLVLLLLSCPCANFCANFSFSGCSFIQYLPNDSKGSLVLVIFKTLAASHSTLTVSVCLFLSLWNTMHTDYVDIPQPFKQDNYYTIKPYDLPSSAYVWFSTMLQFLQTQGSVRFFGGLDAAFFTAGFRVAFIQEPSVRVPFRQEYIIPTIPPPLMISLIGFKLVLIFVLSILLVFGAAQRKTLFLQRRGTWSSPRALLVTPVTTIIRIVVWFLLLILPLKMMTRMVMTRKLMVVFMPSTLMSRHFTLMPRGLKMRHYIFFESCSDENVLQHCNIVDTLNYSQVCQDVQDFASSFPNHFISSYLTTYATKAAAPMQKSYKGNIVEAHLINRSHGAMLKVLQRQHHYTQVVHKCVSPPPISHGGE
jgi:hypothetical protein